MGLSGVSPPVLAPVVVPRPKTDPCYDPYLINVF